MTAKSRARGSLVTIASVAVATSLLTVGPAPAGAARSVERPPRPESQPPADSKQDVLRDRQNAGARTALAGSIPERLRIAGADPALGSKVSAVVLDSSTGAVIYSRNPSLSLMPASNEKLKTAFVALTTMGANKTFRTEVKVDTARTTVWLRGGGDPALTSGQLQTLAQRVRDTVVASGRSSISVRVDDSLFPVPTNAIGWKDSYLPGDVAPVRALVVDGRNVMDTSMDAGAIFAGQLRGLGVGVPSVARGTLYRGGVSVGAVTSPPLVTLVARMVNTSINDYAEALHRQSSLAAGKGATWAAANAHSMATLKAGGVNTLGVAVQDGSGLSRSDRTTATSHTSLLLRIKQNWMVNHVLYGDNALPIAGVSGTLATRFAQPDTLCARGKVRAKTGTLSDVVALSGTAYGVDGQLRIFSIVENGAPDNAAARFALERFATAATGCDPA